MPKNIVNSRAAFALSGILSLVIPYAALAETADLTNLTKPLKPVAVLVESAPQPVRPVRICPYDNKVLKPGESSEDVRTLQSVLAGDQAIYPERLKTGYYGNLTAGAVKKLQKRSGLPETGVVDEATRKVIFPCMTVRVVVPNGGEVWKAGETYAISWELDTFPYVQSQPEATERKTNTGTPLPLSPVAANGTSVLPFYRHLSVDLVKGTSGAVVHHIRSAPLLGERTIKWTVPQSIPEAKIYKIRVSLYKDIPEPFDCKTDPCPLLPQVYPAPWRGHLWDESDEVFTVLNPSQTPTPLPTPFPNPAQAQLKELHQRVRTTIEMLQKILALIEEIM